MYRHHPRSLVSPPPSYSLYPSCLDGHSCRDNAGIIPLLGKLGSFRKIRFMHRSQLTDKKRLDDYNFRFFIVDFRLARQQSCRVWGIESQESKIRNRETTSMVRSNWAKILIIVLASTGLTWGQQPVSPSAWMGTHPRSLLSRNLANLCTSAGSSVRANRMARRDRKSRSWARGRRW